MVALQGVSPEAASVACRQLGFSGAAAPPAPFSRDDPHSRSVHIADLKLAWNFSCSGSESSLSACNVTATGDYDYYKTPAYLLCVPPEGKCSYVWWLQADILKPKFGHVFPGVCACMRSYMHALHVCSPLPSCEPRGNVHVADAWGTKEWTGVRSCTFCQTGCCARAHIHALTPGLTFCWQAFNC